MPPLQPPQEPSAPVPHVGMQVVGDSRSRLHTSHGIDGVGEFSAPMVVPCFLLAIWSVQEVILLGTASLARNHPHGWFSPVHTVSLQACPGCHSLNKNSAWLVCFALCVYVLQGAIVPIFTASTGLQISFSDRLKTTSCSSGFRFVLLQKYVFMKLKFQITSLHISK